MNTFTKPVLLIDEEKCRKNIRSMVEKARQSDVILRPHFKTHQSLAIGNWFKEEGVKNITVSSMDMAMYFKGQFDHITLAIPFNSRQIDALNSLASTQKVALLVDTIRTLELMGDSLAQSVDCWIEVDTGSKRSGVDSADTIQITNMIQFMEEHPLLSWCGFYSHPGHTYKSRGKENVRLVYEEALSEMLHLKKVYSPEMPVRINIGDTPSCSIVDSFPELDSISPGNFVFYDITQTLIGSCTPEEIAVCLACPIISKNEARTELILYGGGIHLSKEQLVENDIIHFGKMVELEEGGWSEPLENCFLRGISQEHGVLKVTQDMFEKYQVGDVVGILPVHSCMTADCMGGYQSLSGQSIDHMRSKR